MRDLTGASTKSPLLRRNLRENAGCTSRPKRRGVAGATSQAKAELETLPSWTFPLLTQGCGEDWHPDAWAC